MERCILCGAGIANGTICAITTLGLVHAAEAPAVYRVWIDDEEHLVETWSKEHVDLIAETEKRRIAALVDFV